MSEDAYRAVLVVEVDIPADLIDGENGTFQQYDEVEEYAIARVEMQLQDFIMQMRGAR